jgi:hypothetical protein
VIALALSLVAVGLVLLLFLPWVGIPVGLVGLAAFVADLAGFVEPRRAPGSA